LRGLSSNPGTLPCKYFTMSETQVVPKICELLKLVFATSEITALKKSHGTVTMTSPC
jgi:hypothetical protein